ncbi:putative transmembrane efflux protein [Pseudonocardia sp. Ae168_Ps1]|uniref:MFS transporter n=1 Tax=unclassified Pseudonocardia TaxID=2619320 RepID=UPI000960FAE4|nr:MULTISPECIES: MFS transporter [unclassified Pseudonocardia]OLL70044.1 putative transmembrane efflux protein [Pseudonocardia sp. Ae150A_Ps1]OLL70363.1 putative transmembrane efflux protein [Pseudonocardia sp. Ae168_Ps1]OLL70833.1 putative transmembrane efflux protein [Pseudonocardia sp. Ae263_Ps1]
MRDDRAAVAVAGLLSFVAMFDMNVVTVALPRIAEGFGADPRSVQWVVLAYAIPAVALLLPAGRWLDRVAVRPALLTAVGVFAAANLMAVVAWSLPVLVGLRALQGVGGAVLMVLMPVLAIAAVAPQRRGRAMAVPATAGPIGGVLGPAVGGPMIEMVGWRVAFVPAVLVSLLAVVLVRRSRIPAGRFTGPDGPGLADAALLITGLGLACAVATGVLTGPAVVATAVAVAVAALATWASRPGARSVAAALLPRGAAPAVAVALLAGAFAAASYLVAVGVQAGGSGPAAAGLALLAFPLGMVVAGPAAGQLADRYSPRAVAIAGVVLAAVGFALLAVLPDAESWNPVDVAWRVALAGLGTGLYGGPTQVLVLAGAAQDRMATAGAGVQCARALGFAVGPAAAALAWNTEGTVLATRPALIVAALTAAGAALVLIPYRDRPTTEEDP